MRRLVLVVAVVLGAGGCGQSTPQQQLFQGAKLGNMVLMSQALKAGARLTATDARGWTALHWTVRHGYADAAAFLLAKDAPINARSPSGTTPLHLAVAWGKSDIVVLLLKRGARVNSRILSGETPLHSAVRRGELTTVRYLLQKGARPLAPNKRGDTPLSLSKKHPPLHKLLDAAGRSS